MLFFQGGKHFLCRAQPRADGIDCNEQKKSKKDKSDMKLIRSGQ
jgi:hypothetical protein